MKSPQLTFVAIPLLFCLLSCSKSDNKPVFKKENPLQGYLTSTGFAEVSSYTNSGDYEFGLRFKPMVSGSITDIIVNFRITKQI